MVYRMIFNQTAYFGRGAIKEIPGVAKSHGFTKAFIVTDPVLLETGTVKKARAENRSPGNAVQLTKLRQRQAEPAGRMHSGWRCQVRRIRC